MPNVPVQAAAEGLPKNFTTQAQRLRSIYSEAEFGLLSRDLIAVSDKLSEASDFCEAIFMAAGTVDDKEEGAVFQRLAMAAKSLVRNARSIVEGVRGIPEARQ
ncbi:hypothetical protein QN219_25400 [Sinorhizobium sp. 7-81]|uniref:hypothetical protein n=1 Tax=Sinorhizobium sp. 8-89 TaxID=3049089 RepID=UPI0024C33703|nr:hypothetical protein [Sinorhizobium sp. 8-89]MDK1493344.1 hypothetical protein [Sinorhizobium sp. 8-89]